MARRTSKTRKHIDKLNAMARQRRILNAKKTGKPDIPTAVLQKLAALNLPPNQWVYDVCLRELLRDAT
jgi:hypothetical protein